MRFSERLVQAWYEGHAGLVAFWPLEKIYAAVVRRKRKAFLQGKAASYRAPVPVIIVGNLTVGGTGKTPLILWLVEYCRARGLRVGVVSRGYGAQPPHWPWSVKAGDSAQQVGDEPSLLVRRCGVPMVIDPQRPRAVQQLLAEHELDVVLSDDGLQHYQLARDVELVLVDEARGLGNGRCLPMGPLREPQDRLQSVDAVLINGARADGEQGFAMYLQPTHLVNVQTGARQSLDYFPPNQQLHAVAGIGNPQRFFITLRQLGWQPLEHAFADHAQFTAADVQFADDLPVIMTEKDAVKCVEFATANHWYLAVDAQPSPAFVRWLDDKFDLMSLNKG